MRYLFIILTVLSVTTFSAFANEVVVENNQAKLEINGAVCAYCAYGMQKSLSKKAWIDRSQGHKGVKSDIDKQIMTLYLKQGQMIDLSDAMTSIKKGGYEPRTFHLRVQGSAVKDEGKLFFNTAAGEKSFELVGENAAKLSSGKAYELQLTVGEDALKALKNNPVAQAQVQTIFQGD